MSLDARSRARRLCSAHGLIMRRLIKRRPVTRRLASKRGFRSPWMQMAAAALALWALLPIAVCAAGEERSTVGHDLTISTDSRWCGGVWGGYYPIRVHVVNRAETRNLRFELTSTPPGQDFRVGRTIGAEQNGAANFTLSVPLLATIYGTLRVYDGSRELTEHARAISFPGWTAEMASRTTMLVISDTTVETATLLDAINASAIGSSGMGGPTGGGIDPSNLVSVLPSSRLPESWIDYTALDMIAVSRETLERLERPARSAILKWVQCGGTIVVYQVGQGAAALEQLERLLEIRDHAMVSAAWRPAARNRRPSEIVVPAEVPGAPPPRSKSGKTAKPAITASTLAGLSASLSAAARKAMQPSRTWRADQPFSRRDVMQGVACAFADDPFPGDVTDWRWFISSLEVSRRTWESRMGMSPRGGSEEFFKFLNGGVHGVPTYAFLFMITVFAVVIGPVNYFYLHRKRMLWLLLVTVPLLSVVTTACLATYSVAAHGFSTKARIRSLTVLDQKSRTAVTTARLAMYAGMAPSGGLRFSPDTAVYPLTPPEQLLPFLSLDWTQTQALTSGWLPSRTRTEFVTVRHSEERGRLEVKPAEPGRLPQTGLPALEAANGFPWDIEALVVADDAGRLRWVRNLAANASAVLVEPSGEDFRTLTDLLARNHPALPDGFVAPTAVSRQWGRFHIDSHFQSGFDHSLMEEKIDSVRRSLTPSGGLPPRSYVAVLKQNPGVETGVRTTTEEMGFHLLVGQY